MVPKEGVEPSCPRGQRFLRPPRLPVPPLRRKRDYNYERFRCQSLSKMKIVAIDANSLLYRAFFAMPHLSTRDGRPTNALYGFTNMLLYIVQNVKPDAVCAAFDAHAKTFRHDEFPDYKAHRPETPEDLVSQAEAARKIVKAMGFRMLEIPGFEADDIIGTIAAEAEKNGHELVIVTGDLDSLQLVSPYVKVVQNVKGVSDTVEYDTSAVEARFGLLPEQMIDFKALKGDPSDNISGVVGIGEKTAISLLKQFGSLEGIYSHIDELKPDRVRKLLEEGRDSAFQSKRLVTIVKNVPLGLSIEDLRWNGIDNESLKQILADLEFTTLLKRLSDANSADVSKETTSSFSTVTSKIIESPADLKDFLEKALLSGKTAIRSDVSNGKLADAVIYGMAFAVDSGNTFYARIQNGQNVGDTGYRVHFQELKNFLENPAIKKIGHDLKPDFTVLLRNGVRMKGVAFDTMLAGYCLDPGKSSYGLEDMVRIHLGTEIPIAKESREQQTLFEEDRENGKKALDACAAASAILALEKELIKKIEFDNLDTILTDIEVPLIEILAEMELRGFLVDADSLSHLSGKLKERIEALTSEIYAEAGMEFNIGSPKQLGFVLFEKLGLQAEVKKKTKSGDYSTNAAILESLAVSYPIVRKILEYRELVKIKSTYADALPKLINERTGRVHTSLNQAVTATGRLSSSDPNLQNIPIRTELGREIRRAFIAPEGKVLVSADYSQIELRILAHVTKDEEMLRAFQNDEDIHTYTATLLYGCAESEVTPDMRRMAKTTNFAVIYGMSDFGLSQQLGITPREAKDWIENYFARFPGVRKYADETVAWAKQKGYVTTLHGRRRYLPDVKSGNYNLRQFAERAAVNMPIQGTAADIMKLAMIKVHRRLHQEYGDCAMIMQVHDELVFEVPAGETERFSATVKEEMEGAFQLNVPLKVDIKSGLNWAEMKPL